MKRNAYKIVNKKAGDLGDVLAGGSDEESR